MKFHKIAIASAGLLLVGGSIRAACAASTPIITAAHQYQTVATMPGTVGTHIVNRIWKLNDGAATNLDACTQTTTAFTQLNGHYGWAFAGAANWLNGCAAGCLTTAPGRRVAVLTSGVLDATGAGSNGYFFFATMESATSTHNLNEVTNGVSTTNGVQTCTGTTTCIMAKAVLPKLAVQTVGGGATYCHQAAGCPGPIAGGSGDVRVTMTLPFPGGDARNFRGYFDVDPGADEIVYEVYQHTGLAQPTDSAVTGSWVAATLIGSFTSADCAGATCTKLMPVSGITGSNLGTLGVRVFIDGFARSNFVSENSNAIAGPNAISGLPTRVEAYAATVNNQPGVELRWATTNESEIVGFNLFASKLRASGFKKVNASQITSSGSANTYVQKISLRTLRKAIGYSHDYFFKLQVVLRDGTTREIGPQEYKVPAGQSQRETGARR